MEEVLRNIQTDLSGKFPNLTVDMETSEDNSPVLYVYRTRGIAKNSDQAPKHLMSPFHIVVSVVSDNDSSGYFPHFELCSFHGKVLISDIKPSAKEFDFKPIDDMSNGQYSVCSGLPITRVDDLSEEQLKNEVLIEHLGQDIVLRSRLCSYTVPRQEDHGSRKCHQCKNISFMPKYEWGENNHSRSLACEVQIKAENMDTSYPGEYEEEIQEEEEENFTHDMEFSNEKQLLENVSDVSNKPEKKFGFKSKYAEFFLMTKETATCRQCGQTYKMSSRSRNGLNYHLKKVHNIMIPKNGYQQGPDDLEREINKFHMGPVVKTPKSKYEEYFEMTKETATCKECSAQYNITKSRNGLSYHLKTVHKIDLVGKSESQCDLDTDPLLEDTDDPEDKPLSLFISAQMNDEEETRKGSSKYDEYFVMTKDEATCRKCGRQYNISSRSKKGLSYHLKHAHNIEIPTGIGQRPFKDTINEDSEEKPLSSFIKTGINGEEKQTGSKYKDFFVMTKNWATCKECGREYNISSRTRSGLRYHLKQAHNIDIVKNRTQDPSRDMDKSYPGEYEEEIQEEDDEENFTHDMEFSGKEQHLESVSDVSNKPEKKFGFKSKYAEFFVMTKEKATCRQCGQTYKMTSRSRNGLNYHLKKVHNIAIPKNRYQQGPDNIETEISNFHMGPVVKTRNNEMVSNTTIEDGERKPFATNDGAFQNQMPVYYSNDEDVKDVPYPDYDYDYQEGCDDQQEQNPIIRTNRSKYNDYFVMTKDEATCRECGAVYNISRNSRTGLQYHLKHVHNIVLPKHVAPQHSFKDEENGDVKHVPDPESDSSDVQQEQNATGMVHSKYDDYFVMTKEEASCKKCSAKYNIANCRNGLRYHLKTVHNIIVERNIAKHRMQEKEVYKTVSSSKYGDYFVMTKNEATCRRCGAKYNIACRSRSGLRYHLKVAHKIFVAKQDRGQGTKSFNVVGGKYVDYFEITKKKAICRQCDARYKISANSRGGLHNHLKRKHNIEIGPTELAEMAGKGAGFPCKVCLVPYSKDSLREQCLERHREVMDLEQQVTCPLCEEVLESRLSVTDHFKQHHQSNSPWETCCCHCLKVLDPKMLSRHIIFKHQLKSKSDREHQTDMTCRICLQDRRHEKKLDQCMRRHEEVFGDLKAECTCPLCELQVPKIDLTDHFNQQHKETGKTCCIECLALIPNEPGTELRRHIITEHHSAESEHLCPDCGTSWKNLFSLEAHINKVHLKKTTHFCDLCAATFHHERQFRRHMDNRHKKLQLDCNHCGKTFTNRIQLRNHLRTHDKLKPYQCRHCSYMSERKGNLSLHVTKVHKKEWSNADIIVHKDILEMQNKKINNDIDIIVKAQTAQNEPKLDVFKEAQVVSKMSLQPVS